MNPFSILKATGLSRSALTVAIVLSLAGCATTHGNKEVGNTGRAEKAIPNASTTQNAVDGSEPANINVDTLFFESNGSPASQTAGDVDQTKPEAVSLKSAARTSNSANASTTPLAVNEPVTLNAKPETRVPYVFVAAEQGRNTVHLPGMTFSVDVAIDTDANLYCYLLDENQRVTQFFPNRLQEDPSVEAGTRMQFPGKFPFEFFASKTSQAETITCIAATQSVGVIPLKNLPVASDVEQIHQTFAAVAGPDVVFGVGVYAVNFK